MSAFGDAPRIEAVLFDLDGTLLQVRMEEFIPAYLGQLATRFAPRVPVERFRRGVRAVIHGLLAVRHPGPSNEELFLAGVEHQLGITPEAFRAAFADWAQGEMATLRSMIEPLPEAAALVGAALSGGRAVVVATNPVFPRALIEARLAWGGLADCPFSLVTSYENTRHCKPDPGYFLDLAAGLGLPPQQCLMVGNDTCHDLAAAAVGMPTFLVETWLIERDGARFAPDYRGSHAALLEFLRQLP